MQESSAFQDLDADQLPTEISSLCMTCGEDGMTRLLLTTIPHFRQVIIMAFECPHCGTKNNEIQSAGEIQPGGVVFTCRVASKADLNRQVVRSESAIIALPELELELPVPKNGTLTTIEGLLAHIKSDLEIAQPVRQHADPDLYAKIESILGKIDDCVQLKMEFTLVLNDAAGNSFIEDLYAPKVDPQLQSSVYERTEEQNVMLGIAAPTEVTPEQVAAEAAMVADDNMDVLHFPAKCSACGWPSETRMHILDIPYFKEVVIMSTVCESCGYKSNEVKAGGAVSDLGRRITLNITEVDDLSRDILKSETCGLSVPEIDLELMPGTLGGRFTTVEGLLQQVHDELQQRFEFNKGDSADTEGKTRFQTFLDNLAQLIQGTLHATLILDDPLANSYLQNLYAPDPDPNLTIIDYERTFDQNEDLGLNDMNV